MASALEEMDVDIKEMDVDMKEIIEEMDEDMKEIIEVEKERIYQTELLEKAKKENIIICLPTGSGKTFIALQLAKYFLADSIKDGKFIIFMATTVPLVYQQSKYFMDHIPSGKHGRIKTITGEDNVDVWGPLDWKDLLEDCTMLFLTPQIVLDGLNHNYMEMERIKLMILDECHNADKGHPMSEIMRLYKEQYDKYDEKDQREKLPRVLGLTATIIRGKPKDLNFEKEIAGIESRMSAKCVTYHKYEEVLKHSTSAQNNIQVEMYENTSNVLWNDEEILKPLTEALTFLSNIKHKFPRVNDKSIDNEHFVHEGQRYSNKSKLLANESISILNELIEVYNDMGPYPARLGGLIRRFYILSKGINECKKDTEDYFFTLVDTAISSFMTRIDLLLSTKPDYEQIEIFISNKLKVLIRRLSEFRNQELCGLVFTAKRITAQILSWFFKDAANKCGDKYSFIKPAFVIGASRDTRDITEVRITTKKQSKIIYGFHRGEFNLIFATSVLEEGLNVPICNVVVRYDEIMSYPSYVQSMGRARKSGACFIVLADPNKPNKKNLDQFKEYNLLLSDHLVKHAVHLDNDDNGDLKNETDAEEERFAEIYKQYIFHPGPDIPRITLNSAIKIVNTFCSTLSISNLSMPSPLAFWEKDDTTKKFRAHIQLPLNSVVRDFVQGDWMENKSLAKKAAHFRVCELLFKEGVLDDRLMPRKKPMPNHIQEFIEINDKPLEHKKSTNWIPKRMPNCFEMYPFSSGQGYNAFKININLTDSRFEDPEMAQLYNFEQKKYSFSVISQFPINIDSFVLNARFGDLTVKFEKIEIMEESRIKSSFSDQEMDVLQTFHDFIFSKLLKIEHPVFDKIMSPSMLLAPICKVACGGCDAYEIYWKLAEDLTYYSQIMIEPKEEDRRNWKFDQELYNDAIVASWYRKSAEPEVYVVMDVINDQNALSKFEEKNINFAQYFKAQYSVDTFNPHNNLLKCKKISKNLNFLCQKHITSLSKEERKDIKDGKSIAKLIPELTNLFPMPGSLYMQAFFLPSILHRISRLLVSQDIQKSVAYEFDWSSAIENGHKRKSVEEDVPKKKSKLSFQVQEPSRNIIPIENKKEFGTLQNVQKPSPSSSINDINNVNVEFIEHADLLTIDLLNSIIENNKKKKNQNNLDLMEINLDEERRSPDQGDIIARYCDDEIEITDFDFQPDFKKESGPDLFTILEAITLTNAQDSIDMEKLETLGDSFLKYIVSVNLFVHHSNWEEGVMTQCRSSVISNNNLYKLGKAKFLDQIIAGSKFHPNSTWLPPSTEVNRRYSELVTEADINYDIFSTYTKERLESASKEELKDDISRFSNDVVKCNSPSNITYTHARLKNKNVADCAEALIGAYYKNGGVCSALRVMKWLEIQIPKAEGGKIYLSHPLHFPKELTTDNSKRNPTLRPEAYIPCLSELEDTLKYEFKNKWLAVEALTHPCFIGTERNTVSYQRLEYLGDAALDFLITQHIFNFDVCKTPGDLTDLRSALVNNVTFASLAVRYGFHKFMLISDQRMHETIDLFQNYQKNNGHKVTGHFTMMNDIETVVVQEIEVPKCLGDVFESIAGAIFVDSGFSLNVLWKVFYRLMKHEIDSFSTVIPKAPIRQIYELFSNVKFNTIEYGASGITKNPNLTYIEMIVNGVKFHGCGENKKSSKQAACKFALKYFSREKNKDLLRI